MEICYHPLHSTYETNKQTKKNQTQGWPKKQKSVCVFAIKHGGLAAKLDVMHWPFLANTEWK